MKTLSKAAGLLLLAAAIEGGVLEILCIDADYQPGQDAKMAQR
jgi:hypothetical protein